MQTGSHRCISHRQTRFDEPASGCAGREFRALLCVMTGKEFGEVAAQVPLNDGFPVRKQNKKKKRIKTFGALAEGRLTDM